MIVVLTGPESVGKTTMCISLAKHFSGVWEPEYGRTYLEHLQRSYTYQDVEHIARMQYMLYNNYKENHSNTFVFIDTYLIITKVWFQVVYNDVPSWIDDAILNSRIDFVLLLAPDVPWEDDPLRENGDSVMRNYLFHLYKKELEYYSIPYYIVRGNGEQRELNSVKGIEQFLRFKNFNNVK